MLSEAEILLMDEPVSKLDEKNRKKVLLDIESKEVKKVEQEYSEAFSAGYKIGLILPFGCIEIKKYINS